MIFMDVIMILRTYEAIRRFILLLDENEIPRLNPCKKLVMVLFCVLLLIRSLSQNIFRGGSELMVLIYGNTFDILPTNKVYLKIVIFTLMYVQDWIPTIIGLGIMIILLAFSGN